MRRHECLPQALLLGLPPAMFVQPTAPFWDATNMLDYNLNVDDQLVFGITEHKHPSCRKNFLADLGQDIAINTFHKMTLAHKEEVQPDNFSLISC